MNRKILFNISLILLCLISFALFLQVQAKEASDLASKVKIDNPKILREQALIFYKNGNYREALSYFESFDPANLTEEIMLLIANCYDSLGNYQKASDNLARIIELNPKSIPAYYNLGILNYKNENFVLAKENFEKVLRYDKTFNAANYNLANCYFKMKDYKKALEYFNKAVRLDPENPKIYYNMALTYQALNDKKNTEKCFDLYKKFNN